MTGYNNGLSTLKLGLKKPYEGGRLSTRLVTDTIGTPISVASPAWAKWVLLEAIGQGGSSSNTGVSPGGSACDRIMPVVPGMVFNAAAYNAQYPSSQPYISLSNGDILIYGTPGDTADPTPYSRYLGGHFTGPRLPAYGCLGDVQALNPAAYASAGWGIGGGGRLAGKLVLPSNIYYAQGVGGSRFRHSSYGTESCGSGAVSLTFAEDKSQLIDFLNWHYKDGWGVDWRDIPEPPKTATPNPSYGVYWS